MSVPSVSIQKKDFVTGSVGPSPLGVLAILAPASSGPYDTPAIYTQDGQAFTDYGPSELVEDLSYTLTEAGNPVIAVRTHASTAATYGAVDATGSPTGTSVATAGAAVPADNYDVLVSWVAGGNVGAAGITYRYSLDGGVSMSGVQALPTGSAPIVLALPNFSRGGSPGVSLSLAAGTVVAGEFLRVLTSHAQATSADLVTALEAMRVSTLPWEAILVDQDAGTGTVALLDGWLAGLESVGKFKMGFVNTRFKTQAHVGSGVVETETAYATAMTTIAAGSAPSIRVSFCADGGAIVSKLTGYKQPRKTALFEAARAMSIATGVEPAFTGDGPLGGGGVAIVDGGGNPAFHNEENSPGLDSLNLTTLRTLVGDRGAYINNGRIFSTVGSDYVLVPHVRTMNAACEVVYQILKRSLSKGVGKRPKDAITGLVYIAEEAALALEGLVNAALRPALKGQVQAVLFTLHRDDDLTSNTGATLTGTVQIEALAYIKKFAIIASFAKDIAVAA